MFNISKEQFSIHFIGLLTIVLQLYAIVYLIDNISIDLILTLVVFSLTVGVMPAIFVHRAWSHRAWKPGKYLNWFGLLMYTFALVGTSIGFVAIHREHHKKADQPGDPHSPHLRSRLSIQFWVFTKVKVNWMRNCVDLLRQADHVWFAKYYWYINSLFWGGLFLITPKYFAMLLAFKGFSIIKAHAINSLLHNSPRWILPINYNGYGPANSLVFNLLSVGSAESWHKNHHDDPTNWKFGWKWYEFDPGALWIRLFVYLGWATVPERKLA